MTTRPKTAALSAACLLAVAALLPALFTGCVGVTASGPAYAEAKASLVPQRDKGLVIVYWSKARSPKALFPAYEIYANNAPLTKTFRIEGFFSWQAAPGPVIVSPVVIPKTDLSTGKAAGVGAASGAAQGAVQGAAAGPIGMLAGAVGGAIGGSIGGAIGAKSAAKMAAKLRETYKPFDVKPGKTYYFRFDPPRLSDHEPMPQIFQVSKEEALQDLGQCRWVNPPGPATPAAAKTPAKAGS